MCAGRCVDSSIRVVARETRNPDVGVCVAARRYDLVGLSISGCGRQPPLDARRTCLNSLGRKRATGGRHPERPASPPLAAYDAFRCPPMKSFPRRWSNSISRPPVALRAAPAFEARIFRKSTRFAPAFCSGVEIPPFHFEVSVSFPSNVARLWPSPLMAERGPASGTTGLLLSRR